ncbi:MAG: VanZ family protein [Bacteroidales bacterium]|nr:VanZ family protein [Bacteroidales bacterium]
MTRKKFSHLALCILLLYYAVLLFLCLYHFKNTGISNYFLGIPTDKCIHFCMFFPFPFVVWFFIKLNYKLHITDGWMYLIIILAGICTAFITEFLQGLTTYRSEDPADAIADTIGIIAGCLLLLATRKWLLRKLLKLLDS